MIAITIADIEAAAQRIRPAIYRSPCPRSAGLSKLIGAEVYCKLEYLQQTGSFKERGACNALRLLDEDTRRRGVITASAGNHALAIAVHAAALAIPATVIMPTMAPLTKIENCRQLGAVVMLHGAHLGEARAQAMALAQARQLTYINGYDDPAVIAGQGTVGLEILEQVPDVEVVVVPVGGGGLIAGIALAIASRRPDVRIIGAEPAFCPSFSAALAAGEPVEVATRPTLADGLAVPCVGANAFAVARAHVDRCVTIGERAIARAVLRLIEKEKAVVEGAGAIGLAACLEALGPQVAGRKVVLPLCGGNIDTTVVGRVIERGLAADGRLCRFDAVISDRPGGLARFTDIIAAAGASVQDILHDRAFASDDINEVTVRCIVETRDADHIRHLHRRLTDAGFDVTFDARCEGNGRAAGMLQ